MFDFELKYLEISCSAFSYIFVELELLPQFARFPKRKISIYIALLQLIVNAELFYDLLPASGNQD